MILLSSCNTQQHTCNLTYMYIAATTEGITQFTFSNLSILKICTRVHMLTYTHMYMVSKFHLPLLYMLQ